VEAAQDSHAVAHAHATANFSISVGSHTMPSHRKSPVSGSQVATSRSFASPFYLLYAPPPRTPNTRRRPARTCAAAGANSGYKGVTFDSNNNYSKPYKAKVWRGGKQVTLGYFATAEEAAMCVARASASQAAAPKPPAASSRKRKIGSEEQPPDVHAPHADIVVIIEGRFVESTPFE